MSSPLRRLLAEIEYRAKSADGKVRHRFFKGPAGGSVTKLYAAGIPLRDTNLFRATCLKPGALAAKITRATGSKLALGAFVLPDTDDRGERKKGRPT